MADNPAPPQEKRGANQGGPRLQVAIHILDDGRVVFGDLPPELAEVAAILAGDDPPERAPPPERGTRQQSPNDEEIG